MFLHVNGFRFIGGIGAHIVRCMISYADEPWKVLENKTL